VIVIALYIIAAWFTLSAAGFTVATLNEPSRRSRAVMMTMTVLFVIVAAVQILAAGEIR
jgi:hypothetical protein